MSHSKDGFLTLKDITITSIPDNINLNDLDLSKINKLEITKKLAQKEKDFIAKYTNLKELIILNVEDGVNLI